MEIKNSGIEQGTDTQQKLLDWAKDHTRRYPNLILLDGNDPTIPLTDITALAQQADTTHITGTPLSPKAIENIVTEVEPRFPQMLDTLDLHERQSGLITAMGRGLEEGKNMIVAANHDAIGNLGFVLAAYIYALRNKQFEFHTGTIVGKIAPFLGRMVGQKVMSLTDVLAYGCDDIYLGYPDTESTIKAGIPEKNADIHNYRMLRVLMKKMKPGGNLMVIDPTGTTNKLVDGVVTLGKVEGATERILSKPSNVLVNTAIWLEDGSNVFTTDGKLRRISNQKNKPGDPVTNLTMEEFMVSHANLLNNAVDPDKAVFETAAQGHVRKAANLAASSLPQSNRN